MRLKELMFYDNNFGLLKIASIVAKELNGNSFSLGKWYDGTKESGDVTMFNFDGMTELERNTVDQYFKIKIGNSEVYSYFNTKGLTDEEKKLVYNDIACLFKAREEQLNRQYYSNLIEYNPIDNYDRTETQTHNEKNTIGQRQTTLANGARSETTAKGARSDSNTETGHTSPFDAGDYTKATNKTETAFTSGAQSDTFTTQAVTDTQTQASASDSNTGGYTLRARGNIGTMTTGYMLDEFRKNALFNFCDEIIKIIESDITCMNYDL